MIFRNKKITVRLTPEEYADLKENPTPPVLKWSLLSAH